MVCFTILKIIMPQITSKRYIPFLDRLDHVTAKLYRIHGIARHVLVSNLIGRSKIILFGLTKSNKPRRKADSYGQ